MQLPGICPQPFFLFIFPFPADIYDQVKEVCVYALPETDAVTYASVKVKCLIRSEISGDYLMGFSQAFFLIMNPHFAFFFTHIITFFLTHVKQK